MAKMSPEVFCGPRVWVWANLAYYYPYYLVAFFLPLGTTGAGCSTSAIIYGYFNINLSTFINFESSL